MATTIKLKSGNYHVQIRRKGQYASKTFSKNLMQSLSPLKQTAEQIKDEVFSSLKSLDSTRSVN